MAKVKAKKGSAGGFNSHIRARINYLHSAAIYLQSTKKTPDATISEGVAKPEDELQSDPAQNASPVKPTAHSHSSRVARSFVSQMRGVSLKSQLRLPVEKKRSFCKRCDTLLAAGTYTEEIRNPSRGARKPWAEIRVVRCNICGTGKWFPRTDKRSQKLADRKKEQNTENASGAAKPT
ncbi:RNAse P Rpr2/Rpp21/SNM1 subunit domain-containing protein [Aspergillus crustosus]